MLYFIHRLAHKIKFIKVFHNQHHVYVNKIGSSGWKLNNIVLYNDNLPSTIDLYITEVIPTFIFSLITNQWWIFIFYYIWAAFLQEELEHKKGLNFTVLTSGDWHLIHHRNPNKNFGLFLPVWDILFRTYKHVDK
jgi:sterol desaturase/sphingolipid hydroxylase (fatty acid hydroxylase superfamily)